MRIIAPEQTAHVGLFYAAADDGQLLPVIDVTHPAFAIELSDADLDQRLRAHMRSIEQRAKTPAFLQNLIVGFMTKRSRLMRAHSGAAGGFLGGMDTYILKLGPGNMRGPYASSVDRMIAGSLPGLSVRLRLQNISYLLADGLCPMLAAGSARALHLLNIGGGPAIDSLNAPLILHMRDPDLLASRPVFIHILDLDEAGPNFGRRALQSLQADGAPLHGLPISLARIRYDWSDASVLRELLHSLKDSPLVAASSEGALFEYGSDDIILANLKVLHEGTAAGAFMVGSVTRADTTGRLLNGGSRAALQMRGLEAFKALAERAGWRVMKCLDRPSGHDVILHKIAPVG